MSDEPNNPIPEPPKISLDIAYAAGPDPAELAAEAEGMPVAPEPAAMAEPPINPPFPPAEVSPAPVEAQTAQSEAPAQPAETPVPPAEAPSAETPEAAPAVAETPEPPTPAPKPQEPKSDKMEWYILKVQSNREESIREGLLRRVAIAGLDRFFGDVIVPTEKVTEFKGGKKRVIKRKLYPGYLVVHMEINDDTWFMVRETPGIGDFTGAAGRPSVMLPHEVERIVAKAEEKSEKAPKLKIGFSEGERVKIKEGTFENFEGEVESIDQTNGQVTVMINIFGRSTPVTLEYWQIETL
ncbi:MAG: transcription termination/antitermination protein NusG [Thermoguttaceae bacterium]